LSCFGSDHLARLHQISSASQDEADSPYFSYDEVQLHVCAAQYTAMYQQAPHRNPPFYRHSVYPFTRCPPLTSPRALPKAASIPTSVHLDIHDQHDALPSTRMVHPTLPPPCLSHISHDTRRGLSRDERGIRSVNQVLVDRGRIPEWRDLELGRIGCLSGWPEVRTAEIRVYLTLAADARQIKISRDTGHRYTGT